MTLSQVAILSKRLIFFTILSIVLSVAGFTSIKIWKVYHPPPQIIVEEKPTARYGILPLPAFSSSTVSTSNYSYSVDTVDGNLPSFGKLVKVFIIPPSFATLLSPQKSKELAEKLNLIPIPETVSDNISKFSNLDSEMTIQLDTGNFVYQKQATVSASPITVDSQSQLILDFKNFLSGLGYLKDELKEGTTKITHLKTDRIQLSIWPAQIEGKTIYTASSEKALINAIILGSAKEIGNYVSINYNFWPVDTSTFETYPLKTSTEALDDLKSGKGTIIKIPTKSQVSIIGVNLGYYESSDYVRFLQPIYVFEGPDFQAYVPAIQNNYYDNETK